MKTICTANELIEKAKALYAEEREIKRLDGWFLAKETEMLSEGKYADLDVELKKAHLLCEVLATVPLSLSDNAIFVGTQRDAFAKSYALINPSFTVEGFSGYCDPIAIYGDIEPNEEFDEARIDRVRRHAAESSMVKSLNRVYASAQSYTKEVVFFVEQVTGHVIPDFRYALRYGVDALIKQASEKDGAFYRAAAVALGGVKILISRYLALVEEKMLVRDEKRSAELERLAKALRSIDKGGAKDLFEALQLYILLWQVMCLEQAPNPYAFSLGNADRIFEEYRGECTREEAAALFCHFLVFYNVGDRSWAISQNVLIGGRDVDGNDLTNTMSYAIMDAYYTMNLPQPILSVKLHAGTPKELYREMGRFFFTPGALTPSLFNDDSLFKLLSFWGVERDDIVDASIAGCQEPLIMGKDNGNTTNSWLSLPKVLEMVLFGGVSTVTGERLMDEDKITPYTEGNIRDAFYSTLSVVLDDMVEAANGASVALSELRVPFLSCFMGGLEYGADMRDSQKQGTRYNGSGCLVHGLSVLADAFVAMDHYEKKRGDRERLLLALKNDFVGYEDVREELLSYPKFGNNIDEVDKEASEIVRRVSGMIRERKNYLGNAFRPDFSSPSTHLTYGYWVGATPDGRRAREMLGYGVDPLYGEASSGLGFRILSGMKLPYECFLGGYASHLGIDPKFFREETALDKGYAFYERVVAPLFFNPLKEGISPFYLYVNVTTPETLRRVLAEPKKYAPSGVYIMRIHGTFVNFLDLSPDIQEDIIRRLDLGSTAIEC